MGEERRENNERKEGAHLEVPSKCAPDWSEYFRGADKARFLVLLEKRPLGPSFPTKQEIGLADLEEEGQGPPPNPPRRALVLGIRAELENWADFGQNAGFWRFGRFGGQGPLERIMRTKGPIWAKTPFFSLLPQF